MPFEVLGLRLPAYLISFKEPYIPWSSSFHCIYVFLVRKTAIIPIYESSSLDLLALAKVLSLVRSTSLRRISTDVRGEHINSRVTFGLSVFHVVLLYLTESLVIITGFPEMHFCLKLKFRVIYESSQ